MESTRSLAVAIGVLSLLSLACESSTNRPDDLIAVSFPSKVGDTWTYAHYDSLSGKAGNVVVTIVDDTILSGQYATVWQCTYPDEIDTIYVTASSDTVRFIDSSPFLQRFREWHGRKFVFPLVVGNKWKGEWWGDSTHVAEKGAVKVMAGDFSEGFKVTERWSGLNDYGSIDTWIVPNIGIVRMHHRGLSFGMANESYELVSYSAVNQ